MYHNPPLPDVAAWRIPQQMKGVVGAYKPDDRRQCPLRPEKILLTDEGPHATSWLAFRGDTVRMRSGPVRCTNAFCHR